MGIDGLVKLGEWFRLICINCYSLKFIATDVEYNTIWSYS